MPKCAQCGTDLPLIDAHAWWRDGKRICQNCAGKSQPVERPPAPPVGELDVWIPILWLVGMIFVGFLSWILGLLGLISAAIFVHYDAKKYGVESHAGLTLLFAIIGLPLHANELHKLRKAQQTGQVGTLVKPTPPAMTPSFAQQASAPSPSTKFCRNCGAKIPRDSKFREECGARLVEVASTGIRPEPTPSMVPKKKESKSVTMGLIVILLIVVWAVFPVFLSDPSWALPLTSTGSGGRYTLRLQNLTPWPMAVRGYWSFSPPITWYGGGPANDFTLMPFMAYTFEYTTYCTGSYCLGAGIPPYVMFAGDVRLLYRIYHVEIRSIGYG